MNSVPANLKRWQEERLWIRGLVPASGGSRIYTPGIYFGFKRDVNTQWQFQKFFTRICIIQKEFQEVPGRCVYHLRSRRWTHVKEPDTGCVSSHHRYNDLGKGKHVGWVWAGGGVELLQKIIELEVKNRWCDFSKTWSVGFTSPRAATDGSVLSGNLHCYDNR